MGVGTVTGGRTRDTRVSNRGTTAGTGRRDRPGRKRVFLTGGTGKLGRHVLREFADRGDRFDVMALVLPTEKDRATIAEYDGLENFHVVLGDVTDARVVGPCVGEADYVLNLAAMVSPLADDDPELTHRVNVGGARTIIRAVKARPDPDAVGLVMVGSVAELGDRSPPNHWGRVGDPVRVAQYDEYALSKVIAERELIDSGLRRWAWLRVPGIFQAGLLEIRDPIMTHPPLEGVMESVSASDGARLLANLCEDDVPEEIWGRVHDVGGGEGWRLTNWEFHTRVMAALGIRDIRRWYDRNWFATRNFHGQWFADSDRLQQLVPFRQDTFDSALKQVARTAPRPVRLAGKVPAPLVKHFVIKPLLHQPRGTLAWIRENDEPRINAFFGSREQWQQIGDWSTFRPPTPDRTPHLLDHGYDETKDPGEWTEQDLRETAAFRGGALRSDHVPPGTTTAPLLWRCAEGHDFTASPKLILTAGHWCPTCVRDPASYQRQAERNAFLAQVELIPR